MKTMEHFRTLKTELLKQPWTGFIHCTGSSHQSTIELYKTPVTYNTKNTATDSKPNLL